MLNPYYITGFVDGEGSFCITFSPTKRLREVVWEVRPSFSVSQNKRDRGVLFQLNEFFACGTVRPSRRDNTYKYEVRNLHELQEKIIPHFKEYPLQTKKKKDFEVLEQIVRLKSGGKHLTKEGVQKIATILLKNKSRGVRIHNLKHICG